MTILDRLTLIALVIGFVLIAYVHEHDEVVTAQRSVEQVPELYCQYSAGYGKRVWDYESIGNNDIITDADDVFNMSMCEKWSEYGKN